MVHILCERGMKASPAAPPPSAKHARCLRTEIIKSADMSASLKSVPNERQARVDLAACYRLAEHFGLNEGIDNHLTMLVPGHDDRFLLAPFGLHWSEVKASDFMVVDFNGRILSGRGPVEPTALCIHT